MRKIVMFNRVSIDGFFAGPKGEIDWFVPDPEPDKTVHELMSIDTVLFGRVTYQLMESSWPPVLVDPKASEAMKRIAKEMSQLTKVVFSSDSLREVTWENSRLVKGNVIDEARKLKLENGLDIAIFGSGTIVQQLTAEGLIDEYLFAVTPTVLGSGKSLFQGIKKSNFEAIEARKFNSGNILIHYKIK